jgi:hypothetical protein
MIVSLEEDDTLVGIMRNDLSVTLKHIDNVAYENLRTQIKEQLGDPVSSQNPGNGTRTDKFEQQDGLYTIRARLDMDARHDAMIIRIDKRLLSAAFPPGWW